MELTIALVQMEIVDGEKESNLRHGLNILKELTKTHEIPDIVCLPELFTTGYDLKNVKEYGENIPGETIEKISIISQNKFVVIGTILEKENDKYYNTAFILGKNGTLIGKYRKIHLFSPMLEKEFLTPGDRIPTFKIPSLKDLTIGVAICYDIRFPEIFRTMALDGAQIIFVPSEFPSPKRKIWKTLLYSRAIENQYFVVGVNRVGQGKSDEFFGCSLVTNGYDFLEKLGAVQEIKLCKINLDILSEIRKSLPLLNDRRTDLY